MEQDAITLPDDDVEMSEKVAMEEESYSYSYVFLTASFIRNS